METKRCGMCTSEIEQYPCPVCGYNGELDDPPKRVFLVPEDEDLSPEPPVNKKKPAPTKKHRKRKKRGLGLVGWLSIILVVLLLLMGGAALYLSVHIWQGATCTAPETCRICRITRGEALPHSWVYDSCTVPGRCAVCGAVQDAAPGHNWQRSDCLTAGSCMVCGEQEPEAPGHDWVPADCENAEHCARCGETAGTPLGHSWDGVTIPAACSRCGAALSEEEQAQTLLDIKSREIFDSLFAARDWKAVYAAADIEDAPFEGAEQYAAYMAAYDSAEPLLLELESNVPFYEVEMDGEAIADFTLCQNETATGWELDTLVLFIERPVTLTVQAPNGSKVSVNGITLDESYIVSRTDSPAGSYLPEGTPGLQNCTWQVTDLIAEPEIAVYDAAGKITDVIRDAKTGIYQAASADSELTDEEKEVVFAALEGYSAFMINASGARSQVTKYFENESQICKDILKMGSELWMNKDRGHKFHDEEILSSQRYNDSLFAVRARIVMETTLKDGSTRDYTVTETMFFKTKNDSWICFAMTNRDVLAPEAVAVPVEDEWADCTDGIRIEQYAGPNFNAHVMLVKDPSRVYLGLSSYNGFSITKAGKRLTEAIVDEEAVAAINAGAFYDDGTSDICVGSTPAGLTIYNGKLVSNVYTGFVPEKGFCGLDSSNRLVVADSMTESEAAALNIVYGCEFGPVLIKDSQINETAYNNEGYNPRTAVGQRADGTLIFVCAEGRQAGSLGATYGELIELLVEYGAVNACNMDGGSSTVMLTRDDAGNVEFINSYSVLQSEPRRMPTFWLVRPTE